MLKKFPTILFLIFAFAALAVSVPAQIDPTNPTNPFGRPRREEPLPKPVLENLKKNELERLKEDYEEMLANGEEAVRLSEEVEKSFQKHNKLNSADLEKLEKLEKLLKKIRNKLGGDDDDSELEVKAEKPSTIGSALSSLKDSAAELFGELKRTSRYSISVVAIQSSNSLINIVRFIRFWKK